MRKSEESRARIAVDQETEATRSLNDLINPNQLREKISLILIAAEFRWGYDIVYLIYEITERGAVTKGKRQISYTERKTG